MGYSLELCLLCWDHPNPCPSLCQVATLALSCSSAAPFWGKDAVARRVEVIDYT